MALFLAALLIVGARMPTVPGADSVVIEGGRIAAIGRGLSRPGAQVIDAGGRLLLPGFIDSHVHLLGGGLSLGGVSLEGARSVEEVLARVRAWAAAHPDAPWIVGRGWSYDLFPGAMPTRQLLDGATGKRPAVLRAYDGHTSWVNSAALGLSRIGPQDPPGGRVVREPGGAPAGALLEDAMDLVRPPRASPREMALALRAAQDRALRAGIVAVHELAADAGDVEVYVELAKRGELVLRVFFSPPLETPLPAAAALRERLSGRLRFGTLKGFVDGVVESGTAHFISEGRGGEPALRARVKAAAEAGFSVSLHAIGDGAVRFALDAFAAAPRRRHRVEHVEVLDPADARRFAELGVVASMQPFHAEPSDSPGAGAWEKRVGARLPHTFPWRELRDAGATLAFGSDWPVMSLDPLRGLAVATSRRNGRGLPRDGWVAAQKLTFAEALDGYTRGAASGLRAEEELGSIAVGRGADLVLLSERADPAEPLSLYWGSIDLTLIDGRVVYERKAR